MSSFFRRFRNSGHMLMETGGKLTQYGIEALSPSPEQIEIYFSGIPDYNGNTIPNVLKRDITFTPNDYKYLYFSDFIYYLSRYGNENTWIAACILSLTRVTEPGGIVSAAVRTLGEGTINKQIICKRVGNTVVCIINVADSKKSHNGVTLHDLFQDKILKIDYPTSTAADSPPVVKVYGIDGTQDTNIVDPPTMGTPNPKPAQLTVSGLEKILAPRRTIVVADPNKVVGEETIIVGFEEKTISKINGIVNNIMQLEEATAAAAAAEAPAHVSEPEVPSGGNRMKKTKSKLKKRRRSRRYRPKTTRKLKKKAHKHSRRRSVRSCYKK
jgi:hypothetical protein